MYGGVLAHVLGHAPRAMEGTGALGGLGALVLAVALVRTHAALVVRSTHVDGGAPLVAIGIFLCAELASWSIDERLRVPAERGVALARAFALAGLAIASLAVAALAVALAAAPAGAGLAWTILGAASAVAVVGVAAAVARRA